MSFIEDKIQKKIRKRVLKDKYYSFHSMEQYDLKLDDNIVLYNNGNQWKIIPLLISLTYPIIYDTYSYEDDKYDVSIVICPITLQSVMFKGKFKFDRYEKYKMILTEDNDVMPIDLNYKINDKFVIQENKRIEVKILTLRNAIISAPDAAFMKCDKPLKSIINLKYYSNHKDIYGELLPPANIHPKTLVYVVRYGISKTQEDKYVILLGNDSNKKTPTGYDIKKSKLTDHLIKYRSKIINKDGYIMPILWYTAKETYESADIEYLSDDLNI
jgi:hypothetical protein